MEAQWDNKKSQIIQGKKEVKKLWLNNYKQQSILAAFLPQKKQLEYEFNIIKAYRIKGLSKIGKTRQAVQDKYNCYYS